VVVTGFGDACRPEGIGPCEGVFSRELSAGQRGKVLQVQRGAQAPTVVNGDNVLQGQPATPPGAPVAVVAPVGGGSMTSAEQTVNTRKNEQLAVDLATKAPQPPAGPGPSTPVTQAPDGGNGGSGTTPDPVAPDPTPPVTTPGPVTSPDPLPPVVTPDPTVKQAGIVWGRWQRVNGLPTKFNIDVEWEKHELVAIKRNYAVFRTAGQEYVAPERGSVGFKLADSEAFVITSYGTTSSAVGATLLNGKLDVDFGNKAFTTSFDAVTRTEVIGFRGEGAVTSDGTLDGNRANGRANFLNVTGLLTNEKGGGAAYIFEGKIDERRSINGAAYWTPAK